MEVLTSKLVYQSSDGHSKVAATLYLPEGTPRAMVQISHGMCEYIRRYEAFAQWLCGHGIAACGNDHLGHLDTTIASGSFKGYFGERGSYRFLVEDLRLLQQQMKQQFPDIPYFLLGHSMGSFVARLFAEKYPDSLSGLILSGTSGRRKLTNFAISQAARICDKRGDKYVSSFLCYLISRGNNRKIKNKQTPMDWLTRDQQVVQKYLRDPGCAFRFTASANHDMLVMVEQCNRDEWFTSLPKELPIYLISGEQDPIGNYGKGVKQVCKKLLEAGLNDVEMRLYPDARHELLNEINKDEVYGHLLDWLEQHIEQ